MRTIDLQGTICVEEMLHALGIEEIPAGCELALDAEVKLVVTVVTVDAEVVRGLVEEGFDDEPEGISLPHLRDAIAALRDGHPRTAMVLFDSVFGGTLSPEMGVIEGALLSRAAA